jgi:hypothetical protein
LFGRVQTIVEAGSDNCSYCFEIVVSNAGDHENECELDEEDGEEEEEDGGDSY